MTKRIFDIVFSFFGLVLLIPIMILISLSIKISCKGSIFFVQDRVGQYGTIFRMIKFRSMHIGSDQSNSISIKGDLRVTYIGSFLRKFCLNTTRRVDPGVSLKVRLNQLESVAVKIFGTA